MLGSSPFPLPVVRPGYLFSFNILENENKALPPKAFPYMDIGKSDLEAQIKSLENRMVLTGGKIDLRFLLGLLLLP